MNSFIKIFSLITLLFISNVYSSENQIVAQQQQQKQQSESRLTCADNSNMCSMIITQDNGEEKAVGARVVYCSGEDCVAYALGQVFFCKRVSRKSATCNGKTMSLASLLAEDYDESSEELSEKKRGLPFETLNYGRRKRMLPFETLNYGKRYFYSSNHKYEDRRSPLPFETLNYGKRMLPFETLNYGKRIPAAAAPSFEGYILGRETNEE